MLYAKSQNGEIISASPHSIAWCPFCETEMLAKCGPINIWHWAHKTLDCDNWSESESWWHLNWKSKMPQDRTEVVIQKNGDCHRADIVTPSGTVLELQKTSLSVQEIKEREQFYERMIWLFELSGPFEKDNLLLRKNQGYFTFRWKYPRKRISYTTAPTFFDLGLGYYLFYLKKMYTDDYCGGWGYMVKMDWFLKKIGAKC